MDSFDSSKLQLIGDNLNEKSIQALGLPSSLLPSLNPVSLILSFIKKLVPNLGTSLFNKIKDRLIGNPTSYKDKGIFGKLAHVIIRVIDAVLGAICGVVGGAVWGAAGAGYAGISGGLSGLATDPLTLHMDNQRSDSYVLHGDPAHSRVNYPGFGNNQGNSYMVPGYPVNPSYPVPPNTPGTYTTPGTNTNPNNPITPSDVKPNYLA